MIKHIRFVLISIINFILAFFSYFYLCMSLTSINLTLKGSSYEIHQPEKGSYIFIGVIMLIGYIIIGGIVQYLLIKLSKKSIKEYLIYLSIIYILGILIGYLFSYIYDHYWYLF